MTYTTYLFPATFMPIVALAAKKQTKSSDEDELEPQGDDETEEEGNESDEEGTEEDAETFDFTDSTDEGESFENEDEWQGQGEGKGKETDDLEQML